VATDWQMPRPGTACASCAHAFEPGETFRACLYDVRAGYERRDYCANCSPPAEPPALATWQTRRPIPATKKNQPFDRAAMYEFFRRLEADPRPDKAQFRFVLALLLWRKRVLKLDRSLTVGEHEEWEFSVPAIGEVHRVARPELAEDELERLSGQLEQLLAAAPDDCDQSPTAREPLNRQPAAPEE
jgi:hypothetical protein